MRYSLEQIQSWADEGEVTSSSVVLEMIEEIRKYRNLALHLATSYHDDIHGDEHHFDDCPLIKDVCPEKK